VQINKHLLKGLKDQNDLQVLIGAALTVFESARDEQRKEETKKSSTRLVLSPGDKVEISALRPQDASQVASKKSSRKRRSVFRRRKRS